MTQIKAYIIVEKLNIYPKLKYILDYCKICNSLETHNKKIHIKIEFARLILTRDLKETRTLKILKIITEKSKIPTTPTSNIAIAPPIIP